jgi:hypothetical protein
MDHPRPRSSIYSDAFELEELLKQITTEAEDQERRKVRALEQELLAELQKAKRDHGKARDRFHAVYNILVECEGVATKILLVLKGVKKSIAKERNIWLASCSSF